MVMLPISIPILLLLIFIIPPMVSGVALLVNGTMLCGGHQAKKEINEQKSLIKDLPFKGKIDSITDEMNKITDKNSNEYKNKELQIEKLKFLQETFYDAIGCNLALCHHAKNKNDLALNNPNLLEWKKKIVAMNAVIKYLGDKNLIDTKMPIKIKDIENIILNGNKEQQINLDHLKTYVEEQTKEINNLSKIKFDINNEVESKVVNVKQESYKETYDNGNNKNETNNNTNKLLKTRENNNINNLNT